MTHKPEAGGEITKLQQLLSQLEVEISVGTDGRFTACTESEPLFCFVRNTEPELEAVIVDTLNSYITSFYDVTKVEVTLQSLPLRSPQIPVQELKPISRIKPSFSSSNSQGRQIAFA